MSEFEAEKTVTAKGPCDCGCGDCADKAKPALVEAQPNKDRRKLLFGGVVATPAVVMLSSRSALATGSHGGWGCTASAHASVNLSKPQTPSCKGLSPGCWKTTRKWPTGFIPGLPDPTGTEWQGMFTVSKDALKTYFKNKYNISTSKADTMAQNFKNHNMTATMFGNVVPLIPSGGYSMMQALHFGDEVQKHTASAFLNAAFFTKTTFGYTVEELHAMILSRYATDRSRLEDDLVWLGGHRGGECPQDGDGDKASKINWPLVLGVSV